MRRKLIRATCCAILAVLIGYLTQTRAAKGEETSAEPRTIACRVIEVHTDAEHGVAIVIFHQSRREEQKRFSELLKKAAGKKAEWQSGGGMWHQGTVERIRSCFGRGLMILYSEAKGPKEGELFTVKFPEAHEGGTK